MRIILQGFRQDAPSFNQYGALLREGIVRGLSSEAFSAWAATFRSGVQRTQDRTNGQVSTIATGIVQHEPEHNGRPASSDSSEHAQQYSTDDLYHAAMQTAGTGEIAQTTAPISLPQLDHDGQPGPSNWNDHNQHFFDDAMYYPAQMIGVAAQAGDGGALLNGYQHLPETFSAQIPGQD